ncbi:MAG: DUF3987 domain-containing protein [Planctomycetaceae bacterium]
MNVLPKVIRDQVLSLARSIGCDPSCVVLPALTVCAGVIGNAPRLRVKRSWFAPPIISSAAIGEIGTQKSPPLCAVVKPLKSRQRKQIAVYRSDMAKYEDDLAAYKRRLKEWTESEEGCLWYC